MSAPAVAAPDPRVAEVRPRLRRYVGAWAALAVVCGTAVWVVDLGSPGGPPPTWLVVVLWAAATFVALPIAEVALPESEENLYLVELALVPVMVLLDPSLAVAVTVAALLVEHLVSRREALKALFNASFPVVGVAVGSAGYHALAGSPVGAAPRAVGAAAVAAIILVAVNTVAFAGVRALLEGVAIGRVLRRDLPTTLLSLGVGATGVLTVVVAVEAPAALPLLAVPALLEWLRMRARAGARELELARDRAEAASATKSALLSRVSHELRTPLHVILGYAQLLDLDEDLDADARQHVASILDAGRHLLGLVDEVLEFSRTGDGDPRLALEPPGGP